MVFHHIHLTLLFGCSKYISCLKNAFFQGCNLFLSMILITDFELMLNSSSFFIISIFGLCFEQPTEAFTPRPSSYVACFTNGLNNSKDMIVADDQVSSIDFRCPSNFNISIVERAHSTGNCLDITSNYININVVIVG